MTVTYDPNKRLATLRERGLDFERAAEVLNGDVVVWPDERFDYGELRVVAIGFLGGRMVVVVWTPRGEARHIISMRKANAREQAHFGKQFAEDRRN
ncbi:MAG: BrnT family toxin [Caulobacter sp.]